MVCWWQMRLFATTQGRKRPGEATEGFSNGFLGTRSETSTEHRRGIFCPRQEQKVAVCLRQMRLFATTQGRKRPGEATEGFPSGFLGRLVQVILADTQGSSTAARISSSNFEDSRTGPARRGPVLFPLQADRSPSGNPLAWSCPERRQQAFLAAVASLRLSAGVSPSIRRLPWHSAADAGPSASSGAPLRCSRSFQLRSAPRCTPSLHPDPPRRPRFSRQAADRGSPSSLAARSPWPGLVPPRCVARRLSDLQHGAAFRCLCGNARMPHAWRGASRGFRRSSAGASGRAASSRRRPARRAGPWCRGSACARSRGGPLPSAP